HMAEKYVEQLVSHETCHQWFYNLIGTNGYAETWMDESMATYFSYRLMARKHGKEDTLIRYPRALGWLPNVRRDDYRYFGLYGAGFSDWCLQSVEIKKRPERGRVSAACTRGADASPLASSDDTPVVAEKAPCTVTVMLRQKGEYTEPTVLGFALGKEEFYNV